MSRLQPVKTIDCCGGAIRAVRYNVDGFYCLTSGSDKKIRLWNPKVGLLLKTYGGHADEVTDAVGSCDSCYIASASFDKSIIYWDVTTGQAVRRLRAHAGGVNCIRFNENSTIAVSGSKDHSVMCWDIRTRNLEPVQIMKDAKDCVTSLIVTNNQIIASSLDGCIRHYDLRVGELSCDKVGESVMYIAQTKDEQCTLAACQDATVRLIDSDHGELLSEYRGHTIDNYRVECGIILNDSQIVSGSTDGCVVVWDFLENKNLHKLQLGDGIVHSLTTHPTSSEVIFAKRRSMHIFELKTDTILQP